MHIFKEEGFFFSSNFVPVFWCLMLATFMRSSLELSLFITSWSRVSCALMWVLAVVCLWQDVSLSSNIMP